MKKLLLVCLMLLALASCKPIKSFNRNVYHGSENPKSGGDFKVLNQYIQKDPKHDEIHQVFSRKITKDPKSNGDLKVLTKDIENDQKHDEIHQVLSRKVIKDPKSNGDLKVLTKDIENDPKHNEIHRFMNRFTDVVSQQSTGRIKIYLH